MTPEKFEPQKTTAPNKPEILQNPTTGDIITKREKEDEKRRREEDPNRWREQR